jgi:urease accessory protein
MNRRFSFAAGLALAAALAPTAGLAHSGGDHVHGLAAGLAHPLLGVDHLAAMVAVGVLAARSPGAARLAVPAAFVVAMLAGALAAMAGVALPAVETGIALSLVVLGAGVALARPVPLALTVPLVTAFGLVHGAAHGLEAPVAGDGAAWVAGFLATTAALHGAGVLAGLQLAGRRAVLAGGGGVTALVGVLALAGA